MTRNDIYNELCQTLIAYEYPESENRRISEDDLYALLCKIQRNWEDIITAPDNKQQNRGTGVIRRLDDLGRIVIPRNLRERVFGSAKASVGAPVEFFLNGKEIILKPYIPESYDE